jgi:repressor LexA
MAMSKLLTKRQQEIFNFICSSMRRHGYPPTRAEISRRFGFRSANAAEDHLRALARKGVIELQGGISRGIRLLQPLVTAVQTRTDLVSSLPLVGRVAAGSPILASENVEEHIALDPSLFRPRPDYLLRVQGMSMRDAGILDGDLLAVHRTPEASNRQIVVARVDDEVTVKRFFKRGNQVSLLPENQDFQPIEIDLAQQELMIEGLGVGVIRNLQSP